MKSFIIFDLDGVLIDSRANMEAAWSTVSKECQLSIPFADYFREIGIPFQDILAKLGVTKDCREIESIFRTASMAHMAEIDFYPGAPKALDDLAQRGAGLGVVSSKDPLRTSAVLARLKVDFKSVRTPNDRYRGKPAPDHLLIALAEANCDPIDALYIGDMVADYMAAKRAGIEYVHAAWGYGDVPSDDCVVARNFDEFMGFLTQDSYDRKI